MELEGLRDWVAPADPSVRSLRIGPDCLLHEGWDLSGLRGLEELVIEASGEALPDLSALQSLRRLQVRNVRFTRWPEGLFELPELRELVVHEPQVEEVPDAVTGLRKLEVLVLTGDILDPHSRLARLSPRLLELPALRELDVSRTRVQELPVGLAAKLETVAARSCFFHEEAFLRFKQEARSLCGVPFKG